MTAPVTAPAATADSVCEHCGAGLYLAPCGCWVDADSVRWCDERDTPMHQPRDGRQPGRCGGAT